MLGDDSTEQTADAESQVPSREDAAVGGTSLVMACHMHKHVEEGRVEVAVAQTDEGGGEVVGDRMMPHYEEDETYQ